MKPFFLLLFVLSSPVALSQTPDSVQLTTIPPKSNFTFGLISSLSFAGALTSTPHLRSYFRAHQIKPASSFSQFAHVNAGFRFKRLRLMTQGGRLVSMPFAPERFDEQRVAQLDHADYVGLMLGYDLLNTRNRRLYLSMGSGSMQYHYSVYRRSPQPVDWQDLPQYTQPGNIPSLRLRNSYLDINVELGQREKRKRSGEHLLRVGYRRGLRPQAWQSDAFVLAGAPTDRFSQFYLQIGYNFSYNFERAADLL